MSEPYRKVTGRLGGLKTSENRDHMREIGRKGGQTTAKKPGHIEKMTQASIEARQKKKTKSNARKIAKALAAEERAKRMFPTTPPDLGG